MWPGPNAHAHKHDCDSTDYQPSMAPSGYHKFRGEPSCVYSLGCSSYYHHIKQERPGKWTVWKMMNFDGHDCDSTEYEPSKAAIEYHTQRGEPSCDYARACCSYYRHVARGLPADAWDNAVRLPDKIPTSVYRIIFSDAFYYGITSCKDEYRASLGYSRNVLLDWKLCNEDHVRETLVICPSRSYARYVEASLIRNHNEEEDGMLLNIVRSEPVLPQPDGSFITV